MHTSSIPLQFGNRFAGLPPAFYTYLQPTPLPDPYLVAASEDAAGLIGLTPSQLAQAPLLDIFTGNSVAPGSQPLAAVYSGHQFGVWAGQLGDGRAILLGNVPGSDGQQQELQLKGAGKTPYSRMGDGRAVLRSSIREFLCSEAMAGLGIPTTRALCVTGSDAPVWRETEETAAVVTRMAPSFIRFGSFEHWAAQDNIPMLQMLADSVIRDFYPALLEEEDCYAALLREVTLRTARLIAHWQAAGFMHGVMNTDNMSILGLTLDYGPFGFMDGFNTKHICNHSDNAGRYAYDMQPRIGLWNCYALAEALLPLIDSEEEAQDALSAYQPAFEQALHTLYKAKLGLVTDEEHDAQLVGQLLTLMQASQTDYAILFRKLSDVSRTGDQQETTLRDMFIDREGFDQWVQLYRARLQREPRDDAARKQAMNKTNPKYILRNYLAQEAIEQAQQGDFTLTHTLHALLRRPFDEQPEHARYAAYPPAWAEQVSVSCSS